MNASEILTAVSAGEDKDWEFKSAKGGLPGSMWETYSAMANTDGGVIVLGVKELDNGNFEIHGLDDPAKSEKNFWSSINDRGKVNANLLVNSDVRIVPVNSKPVLVVQVPRAARRQRPVFVGQNPLDGTFRRYSDGDYQCSRGEVGRMLADQSDEPHDARIVEHFTLADLDSQSLSQYRNVFSARSPNHPWLAESDQGLLAKLGGWREDRSAGRKGLTVAGLQMFGKDEAIRDLAVLPQYQISYREKLSGDLNVRWTDRLTVDGTWVANLFQFYMRVSGLLPRDVLKTPFALSPNMVRIDDTPAHQALREALVNALIHADYGGQGGIVIEKRRDRFELSNPGSLLISFDQVVRGGISECRNKSLQLMFLLIGGGEREGSGIDKIRQGWASLNLQSPAIEELTRPDRVRLILPTVSLLPDDVVSRLRRRFGKSWDCLSSVEIQALVLADTEGEVANSRLRLVTDHHPADLTQVLQGLVGKGLPTQFGQKRGATYRLPPDSGGSPPANGGSPPANGGSPPANGGSPPANGGSPPANGGSPPANGGSPPANGGSPPANGGSPPANGGSPPANGGSPPANGGSPPANGGSPPANGGSPPESDPGLVAIAVPARDRPRLPQDQMRQMIVQLCRNRFLTAAQLGELLSRNPMKLRDRYLSPLCEEGQLQRRFPDEPNRPDQAYRTNPDWKAS